MKILTIDLEDWFHILAHEETRNIKQWENFESRVERNTSWILETLSGHKQKATFFCLGWIARRHPHLVKKISDAGHEIACHGMDHRLIYEQSKEEFSADVRTSLHLLEDLTGKKVRTYRAPGFSVRPGMQWVFEVLTESGISNDCSIFPASRNHGGFPGFGSTGPCLLQTNGLQLNEFPIGLVSLAGKKMVISGGGYFRLFPYNLIRRKLANESYVMTYFHPRDFDPDQPVLRSLPLTRRFMSYTGLKGSRRKFQRLLADFRFITVQEAAEKVVWNTVPVIRYS